jgi:hypothetical protein
MRITVAMATVAMATAMADTMAGVAAEPIADRSKGF